MVADKDMPLCRDERMIVPPYINAQQKQEDCMTEDRQTVFQC